MLFSFNLFSEWKENSQSCAVGVCRWPESSGWQNQGKSVFVCLRFILCPLKSINKERPWKVTAACINLTEIPKPSVSLYGSESVKICGGREVGRPFKDGSHGQSRFNIEMPFEVKGSANCAWLSLMLWNFGVVLHPFHRHADTQSL